MGAYIIISSVYLNICIIKTIFKGKKSHQPNEVFNILQELALNFSHTTIDHIFTMSDINM